MNFDDNKINEVIAQIEASGEKVTLMKIASLSGYKYSDLYNSRQYDKYVKTSRMPARKKKVKAGRNIAFKHIHIDMGPSKFQPVKEAVPVVAVPEVVEPLALAPKVFPYDDKCNLVWSTGSQDKFGLIQIKGLTSNDDFDLDIFAFMLLKAYNKVTGRKGKDRLVHEINQIKF